MDENGFDENGNPDGWLKIFHSLRSDLPELKKIFLLALTVDGNVTIEGGDLWPTTFYDVLFQPLLEDNALTHDGLTGDALNLFKSDIPSKALEDQVLVWGFHYAGSLMTQALNRAIEALNHFDHSGLFSH